MIVEFREVSKSFKRGFLMKPKHVLEKFSFQVNKGDLCGFLGVNGSGKSTSLKLMLDFLKRDSGEIALNLGPSDMHSKLEHIGFLPENPLLPKSFTGIESLKYLCSFYKSYIFELKEVQKLATTLKIDHALDQKISTYSKGMLQRLSFMTAVIHKPRLLILDEPFSGLDPLGRFEFKNILKQLNQNGTTILFTSHVVDDLEDISNTIVILKNKTNSFSGKLNDLLCRSSVNKKKITLYDKCSIGNQLFSFVEKIEENIIIVKNKNVDKVIEIILANRIRIDAIENLIPRLEEIVYDIK